MNIIRMLFPYTDDGLCENKKKKFTSSLRAHKCIKMSGVLYIHKMTFSLPIYGKNLNILDDINYYT